MRKTRLLAVTVILGATLGAADIAAAMETDSPAPPSQPSTKQPAAKPDKQKARTKKPKKESAIENFLAGYRTAYAQIYDKNDYAGGIARLRALGYDDHPDVATLIGYASRKLGRYADAKYWYEQALAADPHHALTWSYYGMWQAEQGNLLKAKDDLEMVRLSCGNTECKPYRMLKAAIDGTVTY